MPEVKDNISNRKVRRDSDSAINGSINDLSNITLTRLSHEQTNVMKNRRIHVLEMTDDASLSYLKDIHKSEPETYADFKKIIEDYDGEIDLRLGAMNIKEKIFSTDKNTTAKVKNSTTRTSTAITRKPKVTQPTTLLKESTLVSIAKNRTKAKTLTFNSDLLRRYKKKLSVNIEKAKKMSATEMRARQDTTLKIYENKTEILQLDNNTIEPTTKNIFIFDENMYSELEMLF